jgi:type I restriction enzyme, R subunit
MSVSTKEIAFERAIEHELLASGGYVQGNADAFDVTLALVPAHMLAFIQASQPTLWAQLTKDHGTNLQQALLDALGKHLASQGMLTVLRHGFKFFGKTVRAAIFRPSHGLNPDVLAQYDANIVAITRQVRCNPDSSETIDMVVTVNGLPVATLELKNSLTGQAVAHARKQYQDRDQRLPIFQWKRGALVHFAVDTDEASMATRLSGHKTFFLPFNRGSEDGASNPTIAGESYKTSYLWREVLTRDSLLDILARFMHLAVEDKKDSTGKTRTVETMIFPRYHQLDVVRKLERAARIEGPGNHYLIQHSAGSGKSNSIAWTAHRLASLHDKDDKKVFDSVVVITDRRVLDKQLQDTIFQFEHKSGVVARVDKHSDQLAKALREGTPIVITTLQKFPFVTEKIGELPTRRYALIVDEAHSSQSGEAARTLREVLAGKNVMGSNDKPFEGVRESKAPYAPIPPAEQDAEEVEETYEDEINRVMGSRGKQPNLSFFAFTATPKGKTLEVFGRRGSDGKPLPFHTYTMRQAIEEGFILDVLRNYTTYKTYYKLIQAKADDPKVKKKDTVRALARYMSLHPHNISQKVEVIVEHFRRHVLHKLQGHAKAMVVTRSRLHAVRYKLATDAYIREKGYTDLAALVAFSGTVIDPEISREFTEPAMNHGISETELPEKFDSDAYQVLIVANKYQTGFDQPLLCAMYVDRKLSGVQAVQTLSRLNRMAGGKTDTFVLDFANEAAEIQEAFQPFYEGTTVSEVADPFQLDQLRHELDTPQIWWDSELEAFAKVFYRPPNKLRDTEHSEIYKHLQPAVDRFVAWKEEQPREEWRAKLLAYLRLYSFLSQIMGYEDRDLEVRYSFGRLLLRRLPRERAERFELDGEVDLHSYRLQRVTETDIALVKGETGEVDSPTVVGTGSKADEEVHLHEIIKIINDRFGTNFTKADELLFDQVIADGQADETVRQRAEANDFENFALSIRERITGLMIDRMDKNEEVVSKFLNEEEFKALVTEHIARMIYKGLRKVG